VLKIEAAASILAEPYKKIIVAEHRLEIIRSYIGKSSWDVVDETK
jgi:hypothetical protein